MAPRPHHHHYTPPTAAPSVPHHKHLLEEALTFRNFGRYGWSVFPIRGKPTVKWTPLQRRRFGDHELARVFDRKPYPTGLAVITGEISEWLCVRDFDEVGPYEQWAERHPDLAASCPTVKTNRGFHVMFRNADRLGVFANWKDGELRGDRSHYVVLPPSLHRKGSTYRWVSDVPWSIAAFPWLTLEQTGFIDPEHPFAWPGWAGHKPGAGAGAGSHTGGIPPQSLGSGAFSSSVESLALPARDAAWSPDVRDVDEAVNVCLPDGPRQRHTCVFRLCRVLRGMPSYANLNPTDPAVEAVFRAWHSRARRVIRTPGYAASWKDFVDGWGRVRHPAGVGLAHARAAMAERPLPPHVCGYGDEPTRRLYVLCRTLADRSADGTFFLGCRDAAKECGFGSWWTANERRKVFVRHGVLEVVEAGKPSATARKATSYRLGPQAA